MHVGRLVAMCGLVANLVASLLLTDVSNLSPDACLAPELLHTLPVFLTLPPIMWKAFLI